MTVIVNGVFGRKEFFEGGGCNAVTSAAKAGILQKWLVWHV
jgi:hypothetical protein